MRIVPDAQSMIAGYLFTRNPTNPVPFKYEEIVHTKYANPSDLWYGLSPLEAALGSVTLLEAAQKFERSLFENGGIPQVGLLYKQQLSEEQRKRLYAEWKQRFGSRIRGEKAIVLAGGDDIKNIGYPPKELGADASRNANVEEVAAAFGIPMTILKTNESNLASAEAGWYQFMKGTISPKLVRLQEILTEQIAQRYYDEKLFLAFDDCVPSDKTYRLQEIQTRLNTKMTTINEERAIDGFEPVEWGDEPPAPPPSPFGAPTSEEAPPEKPPKEPKEEPAKGYKGVRVNRSFTSDLTDCVVGMAREIDEKLKDAD
jgi:HK97 family phage portal protein